MKFAANSILLKIPTEKSLTGFRNTFALSFRTVSGLMGVIVQICKVIFLAGFCGLMIMTLIIFLGVNLFMFIAYSPDTSRSKDG